MANNNGNGKSLESWIWDAACSDQVTQAMIIETFATIDRKLSAAIQRQTALQDLFHTLLHNCDCEDPRSRYQPWK